MAIIFQRHNRVTLLINGRRLPFPSVRRALQHCHYNGIEATFRLKS